MVVVKKFLCRSGDARKAEPPKQKIGRLQQKKKLGRKEMQAGKDEGIHARNHVCGPSSSAARQRVGSFDVGLLRVWKGRYTKAPPSCPARSRLAAQSAEIARMKHAGGRAVSWVGEGFQHQRRPSNANNITKRPWPVHIPTYHSDIHHLGLFLSTSNFTRTALSLRQLINSLLRTAYERTITEK